MAVAAFPPMEGPNNHQHRMSMHASRASNFQPPSFRLPPETALFLAIDMHCRLQNMHSRSQGPVTNEDVVIYYVNRDWSGWVEQRVTRRVYIELKLECTRNRSRDHHKARDDWICLYCRGSFRSKLRLTDHRVVGCPCGPVDSRGSKWELPVYPNLKNAKQGKDLKLALQRGDGSVWDSLQDNSIWLELNPELRDPTFPPAGAKVQVRSFMEPTLDRLAASTGTAGGSAQPTPRPQRPPPRKTFQRLRHRMLSTLKMTTRRTVKTSILKLVSVHMHRWQPITAYSTLHGSSTMRQENINRHLPNVLLVATGMEQTHQGTHHDHHVMRLDHHRLPTPFE